MEQEQVRLEAQNAYLREEIRSGHNFGDIVGHSRAPAEVLDKCDWSPRRIHRS